MPNGNGTFTTTEWDAWNPSYAWQVLTGDVNGDGKADLVGYCVPTGQWWVGLSTGSVVHHLAVGRLEPGRPLDPQGRRRHRRRQGGPRRL